MTDAYFYVNIPYHRPATPSPFRLLQRWAGPLLLGTVLAAIAWHQDHPMLFLSTSPAPATVAAPASSEQISGDFDSYTPFTAQRAVDSQDTAPAPAERASAHPSLVFHNCSVPRIEVKKDHHDMITGVANVSSCDEAKVTLWDSSR